MTVFMAVGVLGLGLLLASLILGDLLDGVLDAVDVDLGGGGILTGPAIGAFLASFGFGAALIDYAADVSQVVAALGGVGVGTVVGGIVGSVTRSLMTMPTDATMRSTDLVGATGTVVTRIPDEGMGEVSLHHAGQILKMNARAADPIPAGTPIVVVDVTSASSVVVRRADDA